MKIKSIFLVKISFVIIFSFWVVYWASQVNFTTQTSMWLWSNNSNISVSYPNGDTQGITSYVNNGDNSSIIWNYFTWYYYDSILWFFRLDWSSNEKQNVRITGSTSKCTSGYWYKLWWYAYSQYQWYIDFDYNDDIFVYYCESDNVLHGYAYAQHIGFQNFEWIGFEIVPILVQVSEPESSLEVFVNDTSLIASPSAPIYDGGESMNTSTTIPSSLPNGIDVTRESIFYIIK